MTSDPLNNRTIKQTQAKGSVSHLLLIRLPMDEDDPVYWSSGQTYGTTSVDGLSDLKERAVGARCVILVPGEAVGLHTLEHEGKLSRTVLQTLPWRLEDELAEEVENLHFALLNHSQGKAYMAVVAQSLMRQWQAWLQSADIHSQQWLPDTLSLPFDDNQCTVLKLDNQYLVRNGEYQGSVCDPSWLPLFLESVQEASEEVEVLDLSPETDDDSNAMSAIDQDHTLRPLLTTAANSSFNLLQGEFQPESAVFRHLKPWRTAAVLLITTGLLTLGLNMSSTAKLNRQSEALRAEANAIYNDLFPGERVVRLEFSLNQKLSALKQPGDDNRQGLPALLDELAPTFESEPSLKPVRLDYDHTRQELRMTAESNSFNTFSRFREKAPASLSVTVQTVEQQESVVTGALVIRSTDQ